MAAAAYRTRRKQQLQEEEEDPSSPRPHTARRQHHHNQGLEEEELVIEENPPNPNSPSTSTSTSTSTSILAAKAIRASSAHMDSSLSSAYLLSSPSPLSPSPSSTSTSTSTIMDSNPHHEYEYTSIKKTLNQESKHGFWGALARKAKSILDNDDHHPPETETETETETGRKSHTLPPPLHKKGLGAISSSLNSIGGAIGNAFEGGLTVVENRTADIIQETRKLHIRRKGTTNSHSENHPATDTRQQPSLHPKIQPRMQTDQDIQLKASRDVAMAMAAKAKLLLRELKTVKADLAFAKDRCAQLEEENRSLRENREKGSNLEDDDLIRLQLETLLAEKARLAQENSVYARENRFLREIVEYHQLTMQDVVYLNEGTEEVTEVYPIRVPSVTNSPFVAGTSPTTPSSRPAEAHRNISLQMNQDVFPVPMPPMEFIEISKSAALQGSVNINPMEDSKSRSISSA